ncbi:MAG: hypothetical protein U0990_09450 [Candidatus Nanopelagicales bacterium]|nr:hypothetical protein [Candidatus Nanopelagicales bacterium]
MAVVREIMEGRQGAGIGIEGPRGYKREFYVETDDADHFPELVMQIPSLVTEGSAVRLGDEYPGHSGLVATYHHREERYDQRKWRMRVDYGLPLVLVGGGTVESRWEWSLDGSAQFEKVYVDRRGKSIAAPKYSVLADQGATGFLEPTGDPDLDRFYYANRHNKLLKLQRHGNEFEPLEGFDRPKPVATLRAFRKVLYPPEAALLTVGDALTAINTDFVTAFWHPNSRTAFPPRSLRFMGMSVQPVGALLATTGQQVLTPDNMRSYEITLSFDWNPDLWDPVRLQHKITWDDGTFSIVFLEDATPAAIAESQFDGHHEVNFHDRVLAPWG